MESRLIDDEQRRVEVLRSYRVLDTAPEEAFDNITRLAAEICAMPVALISLVDNARQWFKARVGMELPHTPREVAFARTPSPLLAPSWSLTRARIRGLPITAS